MGANETFTLYLNSSDLISGNKTNGVWNVNWNSFLPADKSHSFRVSTYFKTFNSTDNRLTDTLFIYSSLSSSNNTFNSTTQGKSKLLAIAEAVNEYTYVPTTAGMTSYYTSKNSPPITIDFPLSSQITITINDSSGSNVNSASLNNYLLILAFEKAN